jgi:hypothetical protein
MSAKAYLNRRLNDLYLEAPSAVVDNLKRFVFTASENPEVRNEKNKFLDPLFVQISKKSAEEIDEWFDRAMEEVDDFKRK